MAGEIGGVGKGGPHGPPLDELTGMEGPGSLQSILQGYLEKRVTRKGVGQERETPPAGEHGPELDPPASDAELGDLESLLMKLKNMSTEAQLKTAREFIEANKTQMAAKHKERIDKLMESLDKADKAKKSGLIGKIFGWIAVTVTAIAAIAACVATGGIAVGPCVGALMAVGMMVLQETGGMDKIMEGLTNLLKDVIPEPGAQALAALIITVAVMAVSLAAASPQSTVACVSKVTGTVARFFGAGAKAVESGGKIIKDIYPIAALAKMATKYQDVAQALTGLSKGGMIATQFGTGATGAASGYANYESLNARADMEEIQKFIVKLQQSMEEETDRIKELIEQMQSGTVIVGQMLQSGAETRSQMLHRMSV
jgi:transloator